VTTARIGVRFAAVLTFAIVAFGPGGARARTATWTGASNNNWSTSGNWSWSPSCAGCVPGTGGSGGAAGADVVISTGTVTVNMNLLDLATVSISGGTVTVSGTSTIATTGAFTVSGGTFTGGTATGNTIQVGGNLTISNSDSSLIGHWKLDEASGTTATDSSASGNNLTYTATSGGGPDVSASVPTVGFQDPLSRLFVTGNRDAALVASVSALRPALPITFSAWYRATNMGTNAGEIASASDSVVLRLSRATNGIDVVKRTASGTWVTLSSSPANFLDGNWHQVVGVFNTTGMTVYYDGTSVASNSNTAAIYYEMPYNNFAIGRNGGTNALCDFDGNIDDVRIYNRALTPGEIGILSTGSQPGTMTIGGPLSVTGSVNVQSTGTLTLTGANAALRMVTNNQTLTMNGTLNASSTASTAPVIEAASGTTANRYHFYVGSVDGAAPTLNISKLRVRHTDANGMRINGNGTTTTTATTTFKQFDNVAFSNGTASGASGVAYLQIYAQSLFLTSQGCSFGAGEAVSALPAKAVKLTGNGFTSGATETRAIFGGTTCADTWTGGGSDKICTSSAKTDNDSTSNGIGDTPSGTGADAAVVQFVRAAMTDPGGTIEGFPTAAFDWTTFTYYSTYVAYHDADPTGTKDRVYVRQADGTAATATYYWEAPAGETIVGTPRWTTKTVSSVTTRYVYVALASGDVYQLVDNISAHTLSTTGASWTTNPFTSPSSVAALAIDATNVYVGGVVSGNNRVWAIKQSDGSLVASAYSVGGAVTSAAPSIWSSGTTRFVTLGFNGFITSIDITNNVMTVSNTSPVGSVSGRIGYGAKTTPTLFVGDDGGNVRGITPTETMNVSRWSYTAGTSTITSSYYDYTGDTLIFGTAAGRLYSITTATGNSVAAMNGYSTGYQPNGNADAFSPPFYANGVLVVGNLGGATTGGRLYVIDRNNTASSPCTSGVPALINQYIFGPSVNVSSVGYDSATNRYMFATSTSLGDGALFYVDGVTDPTNNCN
jgi:hypothetical protein